MTCRLLKVAIGNGSRRVVGRDERTTDVVGERVAPNARLEILIHEHPTKTEPGPVGGSNERGVFRHNLSQVSWPVAQVGDKGLEGFEMVSYVGCDSDPSIRGAIES